MSVILTKDHVERTLKRITHEIIELGYQASDIIFFGILEKGYHIALLMAKYYERFTEEKVLVYPLNIKPFRDDDKKEVLKETLPIDVTGKHIILIDDVLFTGRSVRAGFDAILVYGRPKVVKLAVLIDRGHRELPIRPDFVGKNLPTKTQERVQLNLETWEVFIR